ncbi:polysaccharide lyase [Candidatus Puniceispirillum sp.]|nr:polysaccharide lyase [Candidatus Puniceispirillum sp.]
MASMLTIISLRTNLALSTLDKSFQAVYPTTTMIGLVHQIGGPTGKYLGFKSVPQIVSIKANRKKLQFQFEWLYGEKDKVKTRPIRKNIADIADMLGVWTDISFCLDFVNKNLEAWVNGKSKAKINQSPVTWTPDSIYFKYGIYNTFVSGYKKRWDKDIPTLVVFYDEVRRGTKVTDVDVNLNPALLPLD